ncbi:MAG TPA: tetratricopeptide repeat protein [Planktothrix sp.]|jgi:tetratricopeptide (TPR) repeat protein
MAILTQQENGAWLKLRKDGQLAARAGNFSEAESIFNRALESAKKEFGEHSSHFAVLLADLAECYEAQGKEFEAEECFQRVSTILQNVGK